MKIETKITITVFVVFLLGIMFMADKEQSSVTEVKLPVVLEEVKVVSNNISIIPVINDSKIEVEEEIVIIEPVGIVEEVIIEEVVNQTLEVGNVTLITIKPIELSYYVDFKNKIIPNKWYELWGGKPKKTYSDDNLISAFQVANSTDCYLVNIGADRLKGIIYNMSGEKVYAEVVGISVLGTKWQTQDWGATPDLGDMYCEVLYDIYALQYLPVSNDTKVE